MMVKLFNPVEYRRTERFPRSVDIQMRFFWKKSGAPPP